VRVEVSECPRFPPTERLSSAVATHEPADQCPEQQPDLGRERHVSRHADEDANRKANHRANSDKPNPPAVSGHDGHPPSLPGGMSSLRLLPLTVVPFFEAPHPFAALTHHRYPARPSPRRASTCDTRGQQSRFVMSRRTGHQTLSRPPRLPEVDSGSRRVSDHGPLRPPRNQSRRQAGV
jgi:hypothetical protein